MEDHGSLNVRRSFVPSPAIKDCRETGASLDDPRTRALCGAHVDTGGRGITKLQAAKPTNSRGRARAEREGVERAMARKFLVSVNGTMSLMTSQTLKSTLHGICGLKTNTTGTW